jgi:hypothetical protein
VRTDRRGSRRSLLNASPPVCYRYRTAALVGPWRADPEQAIDDAVRARQAGYEAGGRFHWLVPGSIESSAVAAARVEIG